VTGKERATLRSRLGHARRALVQAARGSEAATAQAHGAAELAQKAFSLAGRAERLACEALARVDDVLRAYPDTSARAAARELADVEAFLLDHPEPPPSSRSRAKP